MRAIFLLSAFVSLPACDAYDRDLGPVPYLCGASEPRCPDEYTCTADPSSGKDICVGPGGNPGGFDCTDDSAIEPNNAVDSPTATPLDTMKTFERDGAICPIGDKDIYKVTITVANQMLEVLVDSEPGGPVLTASILNRTGGTIAVGMPVTGMPTMSRAVFADLPIGEFFAQVAGPSGGSLPVNNYQLSLKITGP
ncbi:MAG: hypothetical protein H0T42_08685 [Deltaproteobacteria bacterium]|nr:hypothetical protein [Deltaproteobacteria bacterium]